MSRKKYLSLSQSHGTHISTQRGVHILNLKFHKDTMWTFSLFSILSIQSLNPGWISYNFQKLESYLFLVVFCYFVLLLEAWVDDKIGTKIVKSQLEEPHMLVTSLSSRKKKDVIFKGDEWGWRIKTKIKLE